MSAPLVQINNLSRVFDVSKPWLNRLVEREEKKFLTAVNDVSFSINQGETFALVGESGSGKSTIAKMVVGLLKASEGEILFDGQPMSTAGCAVHAFSRHRRS
ncbi:MAG: ATP-binding cassette domain-containing protein, partial [Pseudomonadota bacterium]